MCITQKIRIQIVIPLAMLLRNSWNFVKNLANLWWRQSSYVLLCCQPCPGYKSCKVKLCHSCMVLCRAWIKIAALGQTYFFFKYYMYLPLKIDFVCIHCMVCWRTNFACIPGLLQYLILDFTGNIDLDTNIFLTAVGMVQNITLILHFRHPAFKPCL